LIVTQKSGVGSEAVMTNEPPTETPKGEAEARPAIAIIREVVMVEESILKSRFRWECVLNDESVMLRIDVVMDWIINPADETG